MVVVEVDVVVEVLATVDMVVDGVGTVDVVVEVVAAVGGPTVKPNDPDVEGTLMEIVAVPSATPVASPLGVIVAISGFCDVQVMNAVTSPVVPSS